MAMRASSNDNGRSGTAVGAARGYATEEERQMLSFANRFGFRRFRPFSFLVGLLTKFVVFALWCPFLNLTIFFSFSRGLLSPFIKDVKDTLQIRLQQKSTKESNRMNGVPIN